MFDLGIESLERFAPIACYGDIWLLEFRDYSRVLVIEDPTDSPEENYIIESCEEVGATRETTANA